LKFFSQVGAALLMIFMSKTYLITFGNLLTFGDITFGLLTIPLTIFCIVGITNAINMIDGLDGLAGGVSLIAAAAFAVLSYFGGHWEYFLISLALCGAIIGFLRFNWFPAKLFMGDAGSYFVGFCIATATIAATFAGEGLPRHSILAPLCVLAIPFYDTFTVIWIRIRAGKSPFAADRNHISHRLVDLGLTPLQAVLVLYAATAACGLGAFMLHRTGTVGAIIILSCIGILLLIVAWIELGIRRQNTLEADVET